MVMPKAFQERLDPILRRVVEHFGTPFHIYDEDGIIETGERLKRAFGAVEGFKEYFAVKANPNPRILKIMRRLKFGFDCSSNPELILARQVGAKPDDIMFTSNNTALREFQCAAAAGGCILNLDDITLIPKVPLPFPELICFRYNPGPRRTGNAIIGNPVEAKYGVTHEQIVDAYRQAIQRGAKRFGLHTMICSNELNYLYMVETVRMLLEVARLVEGELGIRFEFINMGGGLGIPYKPDDVAIPIEIMAAEISRLLDQFKTQRGYVPKLFLESGRYIVGPHGVFVTTCINQKHTYQEFRGVDASCISSMMRPAMYYPGGGWHNIRVFGKQGPPFEIVNIVGPACENNDQLGRDRQLPIIIEDNLPITEDTGAHCYAMANNYNGRLRPKELLLRPGTVELIRREETFVDYVATLNHEPNVLVLQP